MCVCPRSERKSTSTINTKLGRHKLEFHDADTNIDTDTDILARILADTSDTRDFLKLFLWQAERHADILATILARMSARMSMSVSVSASWNASYKVHDSRSACTDPEVKGQRSTSRGYQMRCRRGYASRHDFSVSSSCSFLLGNVVS